MAVKGGLLARDKIINALEIIAQHWNKTTDDKAQKVQVAKIENRNEFDKLRSLLPVVKSESELLTERIEGFRNEETGARQVLKSSKRFVGPNKAREYLLAIASQLPEAVREKARLEIEALDIKPQDGNTSGMTTSQGSAKRVLNALESIARAWNEAQPSAETKVDVTQIHRADEVRKLLRYLKMEP